MAKLRTGLTRQNQNKQEIFTIGKRYKEYKTEVRERMNGEITAPKVRVIKPNGEHALLSSFDALKMAETFNLDLVEVAPNAEPPVCRIMDYGKFQFEKKKKEKEAKKKQHIVTLKELRFRPHTDDHDYDFKVKHARKFLEDGSKVKATVQFRGRDIIYSSNGEELLKRFTEDLEDIGKVEQKATLEGKRMSLILAPNK